MYMYFYLLYLYSFLKVRSVSIMNDVCVVESLYLPLNLYRSLSISLNLSIDLITTGGGSAPK